MELKWHSKIMHYLFIKNITKIDGTTIDDAEDLDLAMLVYNLLEYNSNYSDTTGSLWFYSKNGATNFNVDIENNAAFKYFMYKTKLGGKTEVQAAPNNNDRVLKNATISVPLKYLSNFWRSIKISLIDE